MGLFLRQHQILQILSHWTKSDAMVKGWLKTSMEKALRNSIRYAKTTREIWKDLQQCFVNGSSSRMYELVQAMAFYNKNNVFLYITLN